MTTRRSRMKINFKNYISELNEAQMMTIQDLLNNFRKVFPYSDKDLSVITYHVDGKDTEDMVCTGVVQSEFEEFGKYKVTVKFHRDDIEQPFSVKNIGEVFCECKAFRYNTAYPDVQSKTFFGQIQGYNRIPNKVRNPEKTPSVCKHLYSFLIYLYNKGLIKNN